ncbi:hypothetical protein METBISCDRAFT_18640 [Metschnikowia bicuspidata]|uniref:Uncharacterized protein n=1 Tax=Metschnikowia bicuspidata TaxID=27322 RepID=A0A4P9Z9L5_9ASCO|nr:hypothetical protein METBISCDRAFT_18640 [Metschnikowia bicuspidata]
MNTSTLSGRETSISNGSLAETIKPTQKPNDTKEVPKKGTNVTFQPEFRKRKLVPKSAGPSGLKYGLWLGGHVGSVVFGTIYHARNLLFLPNRYHINTICYRLSLLCSILALLVTVSRRYGLSHLPRYSMMLALKNIQCILLSLVWLFTFESVFKILPTVLISLLQLAENKEVTVVLKAGDLLGTIITFDEIFLLVYLFLRTLLMFSTSGYQFLAMMMLLWLRVLIDVKTARMLAYTMDLMDGKVSKIQNKKAKKAWSKLKTFIEEKTESHDANNANAKKHQ